MRPDSSPELACSREASSAFTEGVAVEVAVV